MRWNELLLITALAGGFVAGSGRPVFAGETQAPEPAIEQGVGPEQEVITIRGEAHRVWPMDDLRARGFEIPDVPRDENAYFIYLEAINTYKEPAGDLYGGSFDYAVRRGWPKGHDEALTAYLLEKDNQKAVALARQAAGYEKCQISYHGDPQGGIITVLLPNLSSFRFLAKLLIVEGRRLEELGAYDQAFATYTTALRMGAHVSNGFTLIENLVGIAVWNLADQAVAQMVLRRDLPAKQLEEFLRQLNELSPSCPSALSGMRNERLFGFIMVDELVSHPFNMIHNMQSLTGSGWWNATSAAGQSGWRGLEARIGRLALPDRTIKKHMSSYYDKLIEYAGMPAYQAEWNHFDEEAIVSAIPQWNVIAKTLLPSLSRASILGERVRMQAMTTRLAVALRLYALENDGQAPSRLEKLRPWVSADDLIDPFSGKTYAYDCRDAAWRFYSFSENLEDDGGAEDETRFKLDYVVRFPPKDVAPFEPDEENDAD